MKTSSKCNSCPKVVEFEEIYKIMWKTASVKNVSNTHLKEIAFSDLATNLYY